MTRQNVLLCLVSFFVALATPALAGNAFLITGDSTGTVPFINAGRSSGTTDATALGFQVNGTEYMRLTATGGVGIGTATPGTAKVNIVGQTSDNTSYGLIVQNSSGAPLIYAMDNGNVGIGTTSPSYTLDVNGQARLGTNTYIGMGSWTNTQTVCYDGTPGGNSNHLTACSGSSKRFKHNIESLDDRASFNEIIRMRPISFVYNEDHAPNDRTTHVGFLAEEIEAIDPRLVTYDAEGLSNGVQYQNITSVLVGAVKQLKAENDTLRGRLERLEARMK